MKLCNPNGRAPAARALPTSALAALAVALALGACGDGFYDEIEMVLPRQTAAPSAAAALPALLDDAGAPQSPLPAAMPQSGDELTRAGLYALRAQAEALDRALGGAVIWIDVDCCADDAVETALGIVAGLAAARGLGATAPVFVTGSDLRIAAAAVDRLGVHGHTHAFLVTQ